jgi:hypothetical protein
MKITHFNDFSSSANIKLMVGCLFSGDFTQKCLIETQNLIIMKKYLIEKLKALCQLFVISSKPTCSRCHSTNLGKLYYGAYTRGYNNLCKQACGDDGRYCHNCGKVNFTKTLDEYKASLPSWCTAYSE